ncbi:MAG: bifunctional 4-hydroxy-2-oxoglutarate aldolase/2-dehydro-3-deoxy-phosphogluconate aldolase [Pseudomonadota bacterium]
MTPLEASDTLREVAALAPVIPVLVIKDAEHAKPLAEALVAGGLYALEVTLRTPAALEAIHRMAAVEGAVVGAGTVLGPNDVQAAHAAGATFAVSPGATPTLLQACEAEGLPLMPGAATPSEVMALLERGYEMQKFFPAKAAGGVPMLKSIGGPLPQVGFCPTGGITPENLSRFLALPNVVCCGGTWVAPDDLLQSGNWSAIENLAAQAVEAATAPPKSES